jgi:TatA/E family protein of Tat protein translocase
MWDRVSRRPPFTTIPFIVPERAGQLHESHPPYGRDHSTHEEVHMGSFGSAELIILVIALTLLFGSARLPKLARSAGRAKREFEEATRADATP